MWQPWNTSEYLNFLFIKVDFETIRYVTAIATQGRSDHAAQYVKAYRLLYSANCLDFTVYTEACGTDKVHNIKSHDP